MKLLVVSLFIAFLASPTIGESQCVTHFNKSFYVSGEIIWYKVYFPDDFKNRNIAIKVGFWDQEGQMLADVFHKTHGKAFVQGYYQIPFDLKSGQYHFMVFGTNRADKNPITLAEALIPIYNDLERNPSGSTVNLQEQIKEEAKGSPLQNAPLQVSIELLSGNVQQRKMVKAKIQIQDKDGNPVPAGLSVSVMDYALTNGNLPEEKNIIKSKVFDQNIGALLDSTISFQGKLSDSLGQALEAQLLGIYSKNEQTLIYTKSDREGHFSFDLPDFIGSKSIQFLDYQYENIQVAFQTDVQLEKEAPLLYTPEVLSYLNASQQRKKIFQLYNSFEYVLEPEIPPFDIQLPQPDNSFLVQDYERFASVPEFFKEVSTTLKFRQDKKGRYITKMFNPAQNSRQFYPGKPLFIIDGKLTRDANFVAQMDLATLERVDLFFNFEKLRQQFGALGINGVVMITTNLPDPPIPASEEADIFLINGLQSNPNFPGLQAQKKVISPHAPFLQPQLYWNPTVQTNERGELEITFLQSDDISTFCIEVVAQGQNGVYGYGRLDYQVAK